MIRISEADRFELGTVSIFTGLAFITFVPFLMKTLLVFVEPNLFRMVGGSFIFLSAIFYYSSPRYYKKQFFILGINLIIFSFFQLFADTNTQISDSSLLITPLLGIFLVIMSIYLEKRKSN